MILAKCGHSHPDYVALPVLGASLSLFVPLLHLLAPGLLIFLLSVSLVYAELPLLRLQGLPLSSRIVLSSPMVEPVRLLSLETSLLCNLLLGRSVFQAELAAILEAFTHPLLSPAVTVVHTDSLSEVRTLFS